MISKKALASTVLLLLVACAGLVNAYIYAQQTSYLTQTILNKPYYYVDQISNIDSSPDKGTHSNFTDQQYGPDSSFDTLNEESVGEGLVIEDFVDNNTSDVDSSADVGSHSDFSAQQAGPDSNFDTLTEGETTGGLVWYWQEDTTGYTSTSSFETFQFWNSWTTNSSTSGTITKIGIYVFANPGNSPQVKLGIYDDSGGSPNNLLGETNAATITGTGWLDIDINGGGVDISPNTTYHVSHVTNIAPTTQWRYYKTAAPVSDYRDNRVWPNLFDPAGSTSKSGSYRYGAYRLGGFETNYEVDLEVQWTSVVHFLPSEELCIYAGALGSEDLRVDYWSGSDWTNLATDLTANSWNNFTVSLTSVTFTVRFKGGTETGDSTEDQWQIDALLLKCAGTGSKEDAVDNNTSDVDSSADLGNFVDFNNMDTADSNYANLTESVPIVSITYVNNSEAGSTSGTSAQVNKPSGTTEDDFMIALLGSTIGSDTDGSTMFSAPSGWTLEHDYTQNAVSGQHMYIYWKVAGASEPSSYTWTWTSLCGWVAQIITFRGVDTSSPIHAEGTVNQESSNSPLSPSITTTEDNCMIWLYDMCDSDQIPFSGGAPGGTSWIDRTEIIDPGNGMGISTAYFVQSSAGATGNQDWTLDAIEENSGQQYALNPGSSDSRLDQEVQWIDVPYSLPNEELAIYGGSMDAENVIVDVWNGTNWENLFTDLSSGWNNASITEWLTASTFTIRFVDGTQTGDSNQDTWQIDVALVHVWNEENSYELDLEVQWINVDYSEANEELCIYATGSGGSNTFSLDATGGYMIIGSGSVDWGSSAGTISFWTKFDVLSGRPWGQHGDMEIRFSGTNLILDWGATGSLTSATSFIADKWYFIAVAWDEIANTLRLYVGDEDNIPVVDAQSTSWFSAVSILGVVENNFMAARSGYAPLDGHGEELRYWNVERTLSALQSDYNEELTGSETNLRSYFKLNNDFDDTGPNNDDGSGSGSYSFSSDVPFGSVGESLRVDVWNGSTWQNVFTNLANGWNNITVSAYLDSSTFTARFKGSNETGDATQDNWNIDATLLHVWT